MSKPKVKMLTIKEVVQITGIPLSTVNLYCRTKRFPNAVKLPSPVGDYWSIPETDLPLIEKGKPGRKKSENQTSN